MSSYKGFGLLFLLDGGTLRTFSCTGICAGPLAMNRKGPPVPEAAIATKIHEPFDIHGYFSSKFTFYLAFTIDYLTNAIDFSLGKIVRVGIRINIQLAKDLVGSGSSYTVNIGQTDFYPFTPR